MVWKKLLGALSVVLSVPALASCEPLTLEILFPTEGYTTRTDSLLATVTVKGASGSLSFDCKLNEASVPCQASPWFGPIPPPAPNTWIASVNGLVQGSYAWTISATDAAGKRGSASVRFTMDEPLRLTIDSPWPGQVLTSRDATLAFSASLQNGEVQYTCQLDRNPAAPCDSPVSYSGLADGTHTLTVTARDASDERSSTVHVLVASAGPIPLVPVAQISASSDHTCALLSTGKIRCWGPGSLTASTGFPASTPDVDVGGTVVQLATGSRHACALMSNQRVRCWGLNNSGQLGYGTNGDCWSTPCVIGDDESPASAGDVNVGGSVAQITAGALHTCALLTNGKVRCWGRGGSGELGYGNVFDIGDDEVAAVAGDVNVGGAVKQVAAGRSHTCALLTNGRVRCWGSGFLGLLGYGNEAIVGDDEVPSSVGDVNVGGEVAQIAAGGSHTCALLTNGRVRCWGSSGVGQLGYGNTSTIGDDELPASAGDVNLGASALRISTGAIHTCALLANGKVRCWGGNGAGQLGYGNTNAIGDDETPASAGDVNAGENVVDIALGGHTCALLASRNVRCWGPAEVIGYAGVFPVGDNEPPASAGYVPIAFAAPLSTE
ncbi:MAG TPA: hypothetical protein VK524_20980 [Polyangiaceae bacterium]|nr:hypothetical protein [Polyangiaceae bacterium]